ncbi:MAG: hypothetical protein JO061_19890 [Acidobacteriaceae bacterium]|nr:hypothetical protein [Acidobacteriaceae bacterium]
MVVLQRRSRLVTFRVSADEYDALMQACLGSGARSVAEFARIAVLQRARMVDAQAGTLQGDLTTLGKTLGELDATLDLARKRIRDLLGTGTEAEHRNAVRERGEIDEPSAENVKY